MRAITRKSTNRDRTDPIDRRVREDAAQGIVETWDPIRCQHSTHRIRGLTSGVDNGARPWLDPTVADVETSSRRSIIAQHTLGYRTDDGGSRVAPKTEPATSRRRAFLVERCRTRQGERDSPRLRRLDARFQCPCPVRTRRHS
jgi:uncharacterized Fe-S cluster protein YjdI